MYLTMLVVKDEEEEATKELNQKNELFIMDNICWKDESEKNHNQDLRIINW